MRKPKGLRAHLETLAERARDGYLLVSAEGQVEYANPAALAIFAADAAGLANKPVERWIPGLHARPVSPGTEIETEGVSTSGDRFPVECTVTPLDGADGRRWVVVRDVTPRHGLVGSMRLHAAELEQLLGERTRELAELRRSFAAAWEAAPVLVFELDSQGTIASVNRKVVLSLGVPAEHLVGLPLASLAVPERREELDRAMVALLGGSSTPFETRLRAREGTGLDVVFHPARTETAGRINLRLAGLDITARREAERRAEQNLELAEAQRARMERFLRGVGEGVVISDPDGNVRIMNGVAERIFEVEETLAFGRDLFGEQRDADFVAEWREFLAGSGEVHRASLRRGGEQPAPYAVTMSRICTPEGRVAGCICVVHEP